MGDESWTSGLFPPPPSVLYGALRTGYFSAHPDEITRAASFYDANMNGDPTARLKITGLVIKHGEKDRYFPVPLDLVQSKKQTKPLLLKRINNPKGTSSILSEILTSEEIFESYPAGSMIRFDGLETYLKGSAGEAPTIKEASFFRVGEAKTGIARTPATGSVKEGHLYRVEMIRMKSNTSILCEFNNLSVDSTLIKLGAEAKAAAIHPSEYKLFPPPGLSKENETENFKLYLSTPAIFKQGWLPEWIDPENMQGLMPATQIRVQLIAAAIGKPIYLGGFDMKKKRFKPMRKAVPAGSVYYFRVLEGTIPTSVHGQSLSDELADQGFGIALIGKA